MGYYRCAREAAPYMKQAGWGRVINLSGGAGRMPGTAISTPARNIACVALSKSLANTLGPLGINVNAIYPGTTITQAVLERYEKLAKDQGKPLQVYLEEMRQRSLSATSSPPRTLRRSPHFSVRLWPSVSPARPYPYPAVSTPICIASLRSVRKIATSRPRQYFQTHKPEMTKRESPEFMQNGRWRWVNRMHDVASNIEKRMLTTARLFS